MKMSNVRRDPPYFQAEGTNYGLGALEKWRVQLIEGGGDGGYLGLCVRQGNPRASGVRWCSRDRRRAAPFPGR